MTQKWLLAFLVVVIGMLTTTSSWAQTFHSPNGYSLTAPSGWHLTKDGATSGDILVMAKPERKFANNVNVRTNVLPAPVALEQVPAELKSAYQKQFPGYKFVSEKYTTVGGQRAYELIFVHTQGDQYGLLWARQDIVIRGTKLFIFTCTALASNTAHYTSSFNAILKSVHWTGK